MKYFNTEPCVRERDCKMMYTESGSEMVRKEDREMGKQTYHNGTGSETVGNNHTSSCRIANNRQTIRKTKYRDEMLNRKH